MVRSFWGIGWLVAALMMVASSAVAAPRIAVVDFENKSQHGGWRVGRGAADMLTTELVKGTDYEVFERSQLKNVMEEQNLGQSGRVDPSTAAQLGKIIGVQYIVTGAVTEYGNSKSGGGGGGVSVGKKGYYATVDVRVVDTDTAQIVFADSGSGSKSSMNVKVFGFGGGESWNEKSATEAMRGAIDQLVGKFSGAQFAESSAAGSGGGAASGPEVLIADVTGQNVILNAGSGAGLKAGQTVTIKRKGREIKDPSTGKVLKVTYKTLGKVKLTNVAAAYSEGTITSGSGFQVGDVVQP